MVPVPTERTIQMTNPMKNRRMARPPQGADDHGIDSDAQVTSEPGSDALARVTKQSLVLDLLHREGGASLADLVEATGWLPHTARAALTGLRKKGHAIVRNKIDGVTRYSIAAGAAA
jgi:hypothetical protein